VSAYSNVGFTRVRLPDHGTTTLKELLDREPETFLGVAHVQRYGSSMGLLVKMLDLADPIPVHVHPSREFARKYLSSEFGKTEAWIRLGTRSTSTGALPTVWMGFKEEITRQNVRDWVAAQNSAAMYASLHQIDMVEQDILFVPAGLPHALGAGLFVLEPQEPTDFSLTLEYSRYNLDPERVSLGLDWDQALDCIDYTGYTREALMERCVCRPQVVRHEAGGLVVDLLRPEARQFFGAQRIQVAGQLSFGPHSQCTVDLIVHGQGTVAGEFGEVEVDRGAAVFMSASLNTYSYQRRGEEPLELIRCLPPTTTTA
jgi:mannose-6-phosphate isomerase